LFEKDFFITMTLLILAGNRHWSKRRVQSPGRMWTLQISNLYLGSSRRARPLQHSSQVVIPAHRPCRSSHSLHCISAAPAALDRYPRGLAGHVAHPGSLHSDFWLRRDFHHREHEERRGDL